MTHFRENETPSTSPEILDKQTRYQRRKRQVHEGLISIENAQLLSIDIPTPSILVMAQPTRLLVCSIGNPGSYINTFHSAGHTVVSSLANTLHYPSFAKSRAYGNGLISQGEYTLWQSSSLMNISGVGVAAAWREFLKGVREGEEARLVVVHDELEGALGAVKVRDGALSVKGHNGLKSIKEQLKGAPYMRIGVGIGRPISREPNAVANYVLKKMSPVERAKVEGSVPRVMEELRRLSSA